LSGSSRFFGVPGTARFALFSLNDNGGTTSAAEAFPRNPLSVKIKTDAGRVMHDATRDEARHQW
jgi:hypothetical protein